tara:strand:- start:111 stop:1016 length:906 start_codon:yes stop_codon:yes gene_type:complete
MSSVPNWKQRPTKKKVNNFISECILPNICNKKKSDTASIVIDAGGLYSSKATLKLIDAKNNYVINDNPEIIKKAKKQGHISSIPGRSKDIIPKYINKLKKERRKLSLVYLDYMGNINRKKTQGWGPMDDIEQIAPYLKKRGILMVTLAVRKITRQDQKLIFESELEKYPYLKILLHYSYNDSKKVGKRCANMDLWIISNGYNFKLKNEANKCFNIKDDTKFSGRKRKRKEKTHVNNNIFRPKIRSLRLIINSESNLKKQGYSSKRRKKFKMPETGEEWFKRLGILETIRPIGDNINYIRIV